MCMRATMKAARTTVAAATTREAARRWRSRKKRYASMVLRENMRAQSPAAGRRPLAGRTISPWSMAAMKPPAPTAKPALPSGSRLTPRSHTSRCFSGRSPAVGGGEQRAELARDEAVLRVGKGDRKEHDIVPQRAVLPGGAAVVRGRDRAPVAHYPHRPGVDRPQVEEVLLGRDDALLGLPGLAAVGGGQDRGRLADDPAVLGVREVDAEERDLGAAVARLPGLAGIDGVVDGAEVADRPRLARAHRLHAVEVVLDDEGSRTRGQGEHGDEQPGGASDLPPASPGMAVLKQSMRTHHASGRAVNRTTRGTPLPARLTGPGALAHMG